MSNYGYPAPGAMLSLSQSVGYAIRALGCMEEPVCAGGGLVKDISRCADVPHAYLAKIFAKLVRAGILISKRGPGGGTMLARPAHEITLREICGIIDGPDWNDHCLLGMDDCSDERNCPAHAMWKVMRAKIIAELERITLAEVLAFEARKKQEGAGNRGSKNPTSPGSTRKTRRGPAKKGRRRKT